MLIYIYAIRLKQFEILHTVSKTEKQLLTRELAFCMVRSHSLCNNWIQWNKQIWIKSILFKKYYL